MCWNTADGLSIDITSFIYLYDCGYFQVKNVIKIEEEVLREFLCLLVSVTLELQERLRTMFLPTAERCHYIFNMKDIGTVFRFVNVKQLFLINLSLFLVLSIM